MYLPKSHAEYFKIISRQLVQQEMYSTAINYLVGIIIGDL